jgi:hypothetical protein
MVRGIGVRRTPRWGIYVNAGRPALDSPLSGQISGLLVLIVRSFLLWVVIPLGFIAWVFFLPWLLKRGATLGQFLGWVDLNVVALLQRLMAVRVVDGREHPWLRAKEIPSVTHRIKWNAPV